MSCLDAPKVVLIRYGEIALKSQGIRQHFLHLLAHHIKTTLQFAEIEPFSIHLRRGRILVETPWAIRACRIISQWVPGVVSASPCYRLPLSIQTLGDCAVRVLDPLIQPNQGFRVVAHRSIKEGPDSIEIQREVGGIIFERFHDRQLRVDLHCPDWVVEIEGYGDHAYLNLDRIPGLGGMPHNSQRPLSVLVEDREDSLLAGWYLMRRGSPISLIYVRETDDPLDHGVLRTLASRLARFTPSHKIQLQDLPLAELLHRIPHDPPVLAWILRRRAIFKYLRAHPALARHGVVTADQSYFSPPAMLGMFRVTDPLLSVPIYRPLLALDAPLIHEKKLQLGLSTGTERRRSAAEPIDEPIYSEVSIDAWERQHNLNQAVDLAIGAPWLSDLVDAAPFPSVESRGP